MKVERRLLLAQLKSYYLYRHHFRKAEFNLKVEGPVSLCQFTIST